MRTPLMPADFWVRAESAFPDVTAVVEEPNQQKPARSTTTYRESGRPVRGWPAGSQANLACGSAVIPALRLRAWRLSKEETVGRLMGKTAVISGVASGIGALAWRRFCEEGASVVGIDVNESAGKQLADELRANGHDVEFFTTDVTSKEAIDSLAASIRDRFAGLDILYNNAGINLARPLLETTEAEWDNVHNVDLKSAFLMMKAFAPLMQDRPASIINTASMGGLVAYDNMAAYCAAKGGLIMLTKAAALELAPAVRVNVICPTLIDTPMSRRFVGDLPVEFDQAWKAFEGGHPLGRVGKPEDIVPLAVYLASDESLMMTGVALPVDGGWSVR